MRIGILTFHNALNYGAILQCYALYKVLSKTGHKVYIIDYECEGNKVPQKSVDIILNIINKKDLFWMKKIFLVLVYKIMILRDYQNKCKKFETFKGNIKINPISLVAEKYDLIICGSDQIWNPEITNGFNSVYFCAFEDVHTIKCSYAASAGDVETIKQKEYKKDFLKLLTNFNKISVREQSLANFIINESEIQPTVTLDPTLLLEASDYNKIAKNNGYIDKYLLIYQLIRNPKTTEVAKRVAKERNLKIIEVCGTFYTKLHSKNVICDAGPSEFLGLIRDASYIVTTSFHGTALSVVYRKDFSTILSKKRNSRIIDFLTSLGLERRLVAEKDETFSTEQIDYLKPLSILEEKKAQSIDYISSIIEKNKNE
jgi:hypothetical protein